MYSAMFIAEAEKNLMDTVEEQSGNNVTMSTNEAKAEEQDGTSVIISVSDAERTLTHDIEKQDGNDVSLPNKRRKWVSKEIIKLIEARKQREVEVHQGQSTRKGLWKRVSECLAEDGFVRSPDQCKTVWFSLVKKYKVHALHLFLVIISCKINYLTLKMAFFWPLCVAAE